jgi:hypothetical protein
MRTFALALLVGLLALPVAASAAPHHAAVMTKKPARTQKHAKARPAAHRAKPAQHARFESAPRARHARLTTRAKSAKQS